MKHKLFALLGGTIALVGVVILALSIVAQRTQMVPSGPPPTLPSGAEQFSVIRAFADEVAWNRPAAEFGASTRFAQYAERFWNYGSFGGWDDPDKRGALDVRFGDYSMPIYDAREATGTKSVYIANFGYPPYAGYHVEIPWNDHWEPSSGNDAMMIVVNPDTGEAWSTWLLLKSNPSTCLTPSNIAAGFRPFSDLCAGGASRLDNADGSVGDFRTWNSYDSERGAGLPKLAMLTTPYEVRAGAIDHALALTVFNPMFGPTCTTDTIDTAAAGDSCGFYVSPATRMEWPETAYQGCGANSQPTNDETRRKTVPQGMRFALDISDADLEAWLDERGYQGPKRETARIFAVALRDYGMIVVETGCYGRAIAVDGFVNPQARAIWEELGITDDGTADRLLDGLMTQDRVYVVEPAPLSPAITEPRPGLRR